MPSPEQLKQQAQEMMGNRLKMRRMEMSLTQEELGVNVGYSPMAAKQAISQIERGITWLPTRKQDEFVKELHLDPNLMTLASYHYFSRNYEEVVSMLREREEAELRHRTQRLRINMSKSAPPTIPTEPPRITHEKPKVEKEPEIWEETFVEEVKGVEIPILQPAAGEPDPLTVFKNRLQGILSAAEFMEKEQLIQALKKIINE
ncbi:MAG: helix-turn-helix transcriptional regulator [Bacteroidia bacterium]|nr:helix-turn-helix transcriptional regulator [Bacteroidia bacterium]